MKNLSLRLERFLPYRISRLDNEISNGLARAYGPQFNLNVAQWRMLAAAAHLQPTCVTELTEYSAMDKVTVSRAVADLVERKLFHREVDARDRRRSIITLTPAGEDMYGQIAPQAVAFEDALLESLSAKEIENFTKTLDHLLDRIAVLQRGSVGLIPGRRASA